MSRSPAELEELVRALEIAWGEQSERSHAFQREAAGLWSVRAEQDATIAELRREIEELRTGERPMAAVPESLLPPIVTEDPVLRERVERQREEIAQRKLALARLQA